MRPKIIAFSGAHGTGKTTAVKNFADRMRAVVPPGCTIGIITETARSCPLPVYSKICTKPSKEAQEWIFSAQILADIEACKAYDLVIGDRTLVDCIAYTRFFGYYALSNSMERLAKSAMLRYRTVVFNSIIDHNYLVDDGFRAMDIEARSYIEHIMTDTYRRMGIPCFALYDR